MVFTVHEIVPPSCCMYFLGLHPRKYIIPYTVKTMSKCMCMFVAYLVTSDSLECEGLGCIAIKSVEFKPVIAALHTCNMHCHSYTVHVHVHSVTPATCTVTHIQYMYMYTPSHLQHALSLIYSTCTCTLRHTCNMHCHS